MDSKEFNEEEYSELLMGLIVNGGDARSAAMEAIKAAKNGNFEEAEELLRNCSKALTEAHNTQTSLIQAEINGEHIPIMLMMVHAQDHLMDAMVVRDLAEEIVDLYKRM